MVLAHWHPFADAKGYVAEHRSMAEEVLNRFLWPWEIVHHINGDRGDNRLENLAVMPHGEHTRLHWQIRKGRLPTVECRPLRQGTARASLPPASLAPPLFI